MDLRVFLSSTFEDLRDARASITSLLSAVPAELVRMETFGSDETKPAKYCLQQVRRCNLFVGVYAERYGTVDPDTGISMTELEYQEARRMAEEGRMVGILLYVLDADAKWPVRFMDRDSHSIAKLALLKSALRSQHVVSSFVSAEDLALQVLRDVLRKVGVGVGTAFAAQPAVTELAGGSATIPIGMESYTERDAARLRGREAALAAVREMITSHPLVLLVGDSGIGKTSLVQAGLIPVLRSQGWGAAICRPLDNPDLVVPSTLWPQLMKGKLPPDATLATALDLISSAYGTRRVLVVIDQFEDAIPHLGRPDASELLAALRHVHMSRLTNLRVLLCYRGDVDPKVGRHWQWVSGSPTGLPRYYLEPLSAADAETVLWDQLAPSLGARDDALTFIHKSRSRSEG